MEVLDAIGDQCFCQSFLDKPVGWDKVTILLNSALNAPRAGNLNHLRFVLITDPKKKQDVADASIEQSWIGQAPLCIVICSDQEDLKKYYPKRCKHYGVQDAAVAVQNMFLTATTFEMGMYWVRVFDKEKISYLLKLPGHIIPESIVAIGYTSQDKEHNKIPPLDGCVSYDDYGNKERNLKLFPVTREAIKEVKADSEGILQSLKNLIKKEKRN